MPDWNAYAIEQANRARKCPQIERSVAPACVPDFRQPLNLDAIKSVQGLGIRVFFGSDGFLKNSAVREEVRLLRWLLVRKGVEELGFGVDEKDGRSWALVVRADQDTGFLAAVLNAAHGAVFYGKCEVPGLGSLARQQLSELDIDPDEVLGEQID